MNTVKLQEMVNRAVRGAGMDKTDPITASMAIRLEAGQLTLITTDNSNTLYIKEKVTGEDFYCVVEVEKFNKLVSKLTSENVTLEVSDFILTIKANGTYKIELEPDENDQMIQYPDPLTDEYLTGDAKEISLATVKVILNTNKAALATSDEIPAYTGYYIGNKVVTTDTDICCSLNAKLFDMPLLIASQTMDLLNSVNEEKIKVSVKDDVIVFYTETCIIYGYLMNQIDDYDINTINTLLDEEFESSCKVSRIDMLALLDRIGLFVGLYDNGAITLTFTEKGIDISSKQSSGIETIQYQESKNFKPYICSLNIQQLIQQAKAIESDLLNIQYGNEKSIKIIDGDITQIIALNV